MNRTTLTTVSLVVLVWAAMLSFGGVAAETVMLYPNVFGDPPASLERAREFLVAGGPSDYFPPLGASVVLAGLVTTVLTWREPRLRWWVAGAAAVYVTCEFLFSVLFFWPRNEIMFVDPVGTHSPEVLRRVAGEFVAGHRVRLAGGAATAVLVFTALLRWVRADGGRGSATTGSRSQAPGTTRPVS
ncbi:DUF1772 domain-containing protein [Geodermatophilus sabuli]|uniref:DUF1772 domain-containing protein n=1 Tax=Geodermatophilus sabuli TaxID=1564158 RepID=A0A285EHV9_9ACTN|nr:DUF1772 domain-containing protein [Geodermatophilus sabuli]MBB3083952.1 hypothetical protein [Geodermatophilus sabuli]SNX98600.1 protein of unknown function [Geodermatophilus sabuli]